jgi:preprotein translocase subunit Sss1
MASIFGRKWSKHEFSLISKANTYGLLNNKCSPPKTRNVVDATEIGVGYVIRDSHSRSMGIWSTFLAKKRTKHEFSLISKANTYGFLTDNWSPPKSK